MYPETVTHNGVEYKIEIRDDNDIGPPWKFEDGHGDVSDWTTRSKTPGELVLCEDRDAKLYYDFQNACEIARKEGWQTPPYNIPDETPRKRATRAAMADYERLRQWCNGYWNYIGVIVRRADDCPCCGESAALWGIESDSEDYINNEVIPDLIEELEANEHVSTNC
jgi:hypothetical protein